MKFSYNWLKTWVDTSLTAEQMAQLLTMSGLEVESITAATSDFSSVVVAEVINVTKHPDADRLNITQVDAGTGELIQIVCGAPNVKAGIKVPCALIGAILPGNFKIKASKMRGQLSNGMLCSASELGLIDSVDGLLILPDDAPIGYNIRDYLDLDDTIFEVKSTPNRADCLSIKGIAREIVALTNCKHTPVQISVTEPTDNPVFKTTIEQPNDCGRLITRVIKNVNPKIKTPLWIKQRLERSEIRSINFLIDIGNYVMLELGQPMHLFDFDKLDSFIKVRFATAGEKLLCLNDKEVSLKQDSLIIADASGPISIAGIMGGKTTAVAENTTNILLEAAFFYPNTIAGKSREYGFGSDSSYRFERGVDYQLQIDAIERASELILTYAGGQAGANNIVNGVLPETHQVVVRLSRAEKILGIKLDSEMVKLALEHLELNPQPLPDGFSITCPSFRFDLELEIDLIEEIARIYGYDNIQAAQPTGNLKILNSPDGQLSREQLMEKIAHLGYQEVINYAFVDEQWELNFANNQQTIKLINPIASHLNVMRSNLIASLVNNLVYNLNRKQSRVRIFEVAKTFINKSEHYIQEEYLAGLAYGSTWNEQWGSPTKKVDFYDIKNDVTQILGRIHADFETLTDHPALHPGKAAKIIYQGQDIGFIGELHPKLSRQYGLNFSPIVFELNFAIIQNQGKVNHQPISKFQPVRRDLAFIIAENITADTLISTLLKDKPENLISVTVFDVYHGSELPENCKSLAVKISFQAKEKTLQDKEIDAMIAQLINQAGTIGAQLRQ